MKPCPFCAEDIQDAAIVCKHCGKDLTAAATLATSPRWGRRLLIVVGILLVGTIAMLYFGGDHQRFLAFSAQRDAWHRRCDVYVGQAESAIYETNRAEARACKQELEEMTAYGKRQGW